MGQAANVTNKDALDTVITNALIVDAVAGIFKADVGIKVWPMNPPCFLTHDVQTYIHISWDNSVQGERCSSNEVNPM